MSASAPKHSRTWHSALSTRHGRCPASSPPAAHRRPRSDNRSGTFGAARKTALGACPGARQDPSRPFRGEGIQTKWEKCRQNNTNTNEFSHGEKLRTPENKRKEKARKFRGASQCYTDTQPTTQHWMAHRHSSKVEGAADQLLFSLSLSLSLSLSMWLFLVLFCLPLCPLPIPLQFSLLHPISSAVHSLALTPPGLLHWSLYVRPLTLLSPL